MCLHRAHDGVKTMQHSPLHDIDSLTWTHMSSIIINSNVVFIPLCAVFQLSFLTTCMHVSFTSLRWPEWKHLTAWKRMCISTCLIWLRTLIFAYLCMATWRHAAIFPLRTNNDFHHPLVHFHDSRIAEKILLLSSQITNDIQVGMSFHFYMTTGCDSSLDNINPNLCHVAPHGTRWRHENVRYTYCNGHHVCQMRTLSAELLVPCHDSALK